MLWHVCYVPPESSNQLKLCCWPKAHWYQQGTQSSWPASVAPCWCKQAKLSPWCVQKTVFYSHHQLVQSQRWLPAGGCIEQEVSNSRGNGPGVSGPHSPAPEEHPHPCWTWWRQQELYQYSCMASNEIDTAILNQTYELTISRGKVLQNTKLQASKLYWPTYTLQPP